MKLSMFKMACEVRYPNRDFNNQKGLLIDLFEIDFTEAQNIHGELIFTKTDSIFPKELRIGPRRILLSMNTCPRHLDFTDWVQLILGKIRPFFPRMEIFWMEVQGVHLYPLNSIEEFFEIISVMPDYASLEFSDNGVRFYTLDDGFKVNTLCGYLEREQAIKLFPRINHAGITDLSLIIDIDIACSLALDLGALVGSSAGFIRRASSLMGTNIQKIIGN